MQAFDWRTKRHVFNRRAETVPLLRQQRPIFARILKIKIHDRSLFGEVVISNLDFLLTAM